MRVETLLIEKPDELRGVNSRVDLADLSRVLRARKNRSLMFEGVTLDDPSTTYVDEDVVIGEDTTIGPHVLLEGRTRIGRGCRIGPGVRLTNTTLGNGVTVLDRSVIVDSTIEAGAQVGPFAHVRPQSIVEENARVGNFVELKKTVLGRGSKANHLAYLGDATIGEQVNIGAGTITCNYDGVAKNPTVIEDQRVHRQRHAADRAGSRGQGRVRRGRLVDHGGRSSRLARHLARPPGEQARVGRQTTRAPDQDAKRPLTCAASSATSDPNRSCR